MIIILKNNVLKLKKHNEFYHSEFHTTRIIPLGKLNHIKINIVLLLILYSINANYSEICKYR